MTNHDGILENLPAYALGGLEPEEARMVEEHLRGCDSCRGELASYELPIHALDLSVPEASPPEGARERLLARAEPFAPRRRRTKSQRDKRKLLDRFPAGSPGCPG